MSIELEQLKSQVNNLTEFVNTMIANAKKTTAFTEQYESDYYIRITNGTANFKVKVSDLLGDYLPTGGYAGTAQDIVNLITGTTLIPFEDFCVHQSKTNTDAGLTEMSSGDLVYGYVTENIYANPAIYNGGDKTDSTNYTFINTIKF